MRSNRVLALGFAALNGAQAQVTGQKIKTRLWTRKLLQSVKTHYRSSFDRIKISGSRWDPARLKEEIKGCGAVSDWEKSGTKPAWNTGNWWSLTASEGMLIRLSRPLSTERVGLRRK
ncbi:uncharacterized protein MYCFIDRAFT_197897 [Pseudocercospora fijiensis CIRAD86]|uniref:Uncharacterized protein n=1 Tax=Pseudocercospora fijiensis (strain CIRAD86) TaxID=383855 RepID=M3AUB9_PSEFD|nr:uncharacterized protein MYCFIDRAFT_197897 [Pseudocercospora fijiensis CIRAD86]EME81077.1 hypothetical protein MYCFIDRAFT_197897 [Pseudocercospora fijiensis CIRAD86]